MNKKQIIVFIFEREKKIFGIALLYIKSLNKFALKTGIELFDEIRLSEWEPRRLSMDMDICKMAD